MKMAIGMDIGGTNTKVAFVTEKAEILYSTSFATLSYAPFDDFLKRVKEKVSEGLRIVKNDYELLGMGVGAPNANPRTGMIQDPPNLGWGTVSLAKDLEDILDMPVRLDNDANIAATGEMYFGEARGMKNFITVTLGTGVGTGVVVEGALMTGANGLASEGGHICIEPKGRLCGCGGIGHLEAYASATGLEKTAKELMGKELSGKEVFELWQKGDVLADKVFSQTAEYLGRGLATMASLFAPQAFILAGGVSGAGEEFRKRVEKNLNEYIFPSFKGHVKVLISSVSREEGAILGAASLVFSDKE